MGVLGVLTEAQLNSRSDLAVITAMDTATRNYWIDLAEQMLDLLDLNKSRSGFDTIFEYAVQILVEHLVVRNQESIVYAVNTPFRSERMGSYSYTMAPGIVDSKSLFPELPALLRMIVKKFLNNADPIAYSTAVFYEALADSEGISKYHDWVDDQVLENPDLFYISLE